MIKQIDRIKASAGNKGGRIIAGEPVKSRTRSRAKNRFISGVCVLIVWCSVACSHSPDDGKGAPPDGNPDRIVSVYAAGSFDGRPAFAGNEAIGRLAAAWQGAGFRIAWLEGCEVKYEQPVYNPAVAAARLLNCVPVFARNEWTENGCRGDGLLLRHSLTRQDVTAIASDCYLKTVDTFVDAARTLPMTVGTVCLQTEGQVRLAQKPLVEAAAGGVLVIGSIRKSLLPAWEAVWQTASVPVRRTMVDPAPDASYAFFVLGSPAWLVRDAVADPDGTLVFIRLQIERM